MTLTQAPDEWQALRQRMRTLTMNVRAAGYKCQWAWTVEVGKQTGMRHIHALQHGDFIPQRELSDLWARRVDIRVIPHARGAALYTMKEAQRVAGYVTKDARRYLLDHLDRNGGRVCHLSRGYLHGKRTREVEKILWPGQEELTWVLEARHDTIRGPGCVKLAEIAGLPLPHRKGGERLS